MRQRWDLEDMVHFLRPLQHCRVEEVAVNSLTDVSSLDFKVLAPVCQGCSRLVFMYSNVLYTLEF